jgi:hypothetical protein
MVKKILLGLLALLIIIQFFRPAKNNSNDNTHHFAKQYPMMPEVVATFAKACDDCHTNNTRYPWYAQIQPVAWWLDSHITDGKRHFNLSELGSRRKAIQFHKMEEVVEMVEEGAMPLDSYTWAHRDAKLTQIEKNGIITWAKSVMDQMRATFPADSLVMPKRN